MRCEVLLFAQLREAIGQDRLIVDLPDGATVGDALAALSQRYEPIAAMQGKLAAAVNEAYAPPHAPLADGSTIAIIPPVSGG